MTRLQPGDIVTVPKMKDAQGTVVRAINDPREEERYYVSMRRGQIWSLPGAWLRVRTKSRISPSETPEIKQSQKPPRDDR